MTNALIWSERLLALAILFQTIELLEMRKSWSKSGIWRWSVLQNDYPSVLRPLLGLFLGDRGFIGLLGIRILCCLAVWMLAPSALLMGVIFFSTWMVCVRWRGTFNGGSDSMTALIALSLWVAQSFADKPWVVRACLGYIAVQVSASYVVAGWVKLRNPIWRNGRALPLFFQIPGYDSPPAWIRDLLEQPALARFAGLSVIAFELSFPLAWTSPQICLAFIAAALTFHLLNFWVFGLNRFVFAWLAAYPALYLWSHHR